MIKMEAQEKLEWIIQQVEHEAESPPQIRWRVDMLELAQSDARPLVVSSTATLDQCNGVTC